MLNCKWNLTLHRPTYLTSPSESSRSHGSDQPLLHHAECICVCYPGIQPALYFRTRGGWRSGTSGRPTQPTTIVNCPHTRLGRLGLPFLFPVRYIEHHYHFSCSHQSVQVHIDTINTDVHTCIWFVFNRQVLDQILEASDNKFYTVLLLLATFFQGS